MRTALSILLAVLAGLLAALSLVGARAEALVHTPEPLQRIAGPMSEDPALREALPAELAEVVGDQLPEGLPGFLESSVTGLVQGAAGGLVTDERFPAAWAETVEQTRTDWAGRMDRLAGRGTTPASDPGAQAGTVHLQTGPLLDLGIDRLAASVSGLPGGETVSQTLRDGLDGAAADSPVRSVDLSVPDPETVDPDAVAWAVDNLYRWPWLAGTAAVLVLLALMVAPRRRKGTPLVAAGITVLAAGAVARWALGRMAPAADLDGIARAAAGSLLDGVRDYAMPDTLLLIVGGGVVAALGLMVALVSGLRADR
ncbi:hypothetical protein ABDK96_09410 [Citricoccus nitrophenolicus]|uniref:Integral membrane protein n=1 Tax=Citricoccus nitrophenolicus TaxID=863575 RepID=A0ABV0IIS2_9MICC